MGADFKKTLVLDSSYIPRSIIPSTRAFVIVYKGNAEVIESHPVHFKLVDEDLKINKPSIIRVPKYIKTDHHKVPLTKINVIPQSKGGGNKWNNLVTACKSCNNKKASLDLEEFGVEIEIPRKPHYLMLLKQLNYIYESWKPYLLF